MGSWWDRDPANWLQMAGIAMASWCEGTEHRLAPDRGTWGGGREEGEAKQQRGGEGRGGLRAFQVYRREWSHCICTLHCWFNNALGSFMSSNRLCFMTCLWKRVICFTLTSLLRQWPSAKRFKWPPAKGLGGSESEGDSFLFYFFFMFKSWWHMYIEGCLCFPY